MSAFEPEKRPDPDALLARVQQDDARQRRGKLKVFFGASAGVGKTYAMLEAARKRKAEGIDVVVAYVEPHGRDETERLLEGLEQLPPRIAEYRGASLREFDLDAALARKPALALVDEFAHTNVAGSRHAKRWRDVEELLAAGIDVYTTVNVQHIESLNDVVAQITGARMQETVPDKVFDEADEIELIDITPDELLQRLKEGKVYVPERAQHALENFFRKGNLIALRELAMRAAADRVDAEMREYRDEHAIRDTWAAGENLMVCVGPDAQAEKLVRAGKRMAAALHARWLVVYVETPELLRMPETERNRRIDLLRLAESLGAESVTLDGPSAAEAILEYARARNVNRVLVGKPNRRGWRSWLRPSTTSQLVRQARDIDVYVVSGEDAARTRLAPVLARSSAYLGLAPEGSGKKRAPGYVWAVATSALCTAICWGLKARFDLPNLIMIYLLGAAMIAARFGRGPAVASAILNVAAFDFFFVPPFFTFAVADTQYVATFAVMLAVTLIIGNLTASVRLQARVAGHRERRTASLYAMSRELAATRGAENLARIAVRHTSEVFDSQVVLLLPDADGRIAHPREASLPGSLRGADLSVAQWVYDHGQNAGLGTDTLPGGDAIYLPLKITGSSLAETGAKKQAAASPPAPALGVLALLPANPRRVLLPEQLHLLETFAGQVALALERVHLADQAHQTEIDAENERMRNSLLSAISHDLRTPLAVIAGSASTLVEGGAALAEPNRKALAQAICDQTRQMTQQVNNILDMTRFEIGAPKLNRQWQPLEEIVGAVLNRMQPGLQGRKLVVNLPGDLPLVLIDGVLIAQVLSNLLENAGKYTPPGSPIEIEAWAAGDEITVSVVDRGPGIKPGDEERVFEKFHRGAPEGADSGAGLGLTICRAIVDAHGGRIWAENRFVGGAMFCFTLPSGGTPPTVERETDFA
ncbi:MAG: sensor histidine kinase KdpD [Burkholderiales bacterium]|nr:sensor histidine kinase KdpD [Burkholderiales bacterium]